jgi:hypothetical protein
MTFATVETKDDPYLHAIPYMQFPVLQAGRPFTGERASIPGVTYWNPGGDFWMKRCQEAWQFYQANPNGPYMYGAWDTFPPRPEIRPTHAQWLERYFPLVEEGTLAWIEVGESSLFAEPLPKNTVASVFANRDVHLALANYGHDSVEVTTADVYAPANELSAVPRNRWPIAARSLEILCRQV